MILLRLHCFTSRIFIDIGSIELKKNLFYALHRNLTPAQVGVGPSLPHGMPFSKLDKSQFSPVFLKEKAPHHMATKKKIPKLYCGVFSDSPDI